MKLSLYWVGIKFYTENFNPIFDVDECADSVASCGEELFCVNKPGLSFEMMNKNIKTNWYKYYT